MEEKEQNLKIEEITKKINEVLELNEMNDLIQSNEKIFDFKDVTYRVHKPNYKEKQEAYQKRVEKFTELIRNDKYSLEEDLKKDYKKRNIDIDAMMTEIVNKLKRRDELMMQLGETIKNGSSEEDLLKYKVEIQGMNREIQNISIQKSGLLEFSIENQVMIYTYSYLTYLLSEKKEGETWVKVWKNFDEFQNDNTSIANRLSYYVTQIVNTEEI